MQSTADLLDIAPFPYKRDAHAVRLCGSLNYAGKYTWLSSSVNNLKYFCAREMHVDQVYAFQIGEFRSIDFSDYFVAISVNAIETVLQHCQSVTVSVALRNDCIDVAEFMERKNNKFFWWILIV